MTKIMATNSYECFLDFYACFLEVLAAVQLLILGFIIPAMYFAIISLKKKRELYINQYADCMADTYFYGFLQKVVPKDRNNELDGIRGRIIAYKAIHGFTDDNFPFNKLFIIITKTGYMPSQLKGFDQKRIECLQEVIPIYMERAGVEKREYKSSIYRIYYPDLFQHISVAMTGAPPLLCLKEGCQNNECLKRYKRELIYLFYKKLCEKLKRHKEFEDFIELVYFDNEKQNLADYFVLKHMMLNE